MSSAVFDVKAFFAGREELRRSFVQTHFKTSFSMEPLAQDWASRRYFHIVSGDKTYVLMEAVPDHIQTATMGHKLSAYLKIAGLLRARGIHTPAILAADESEGFVLLEDLGNTTVYKAMENGGDVFSLYEKATDVLIAMRDNIGLDDLCNFPKYKDSYIRKGMQRIVDWYIPATRREKNQDDLLPSYLAAWSDVTVKLSPPPIGFVHGDFHMQNLMLLKDGTCGVLDFQDAMAGPVPYDLANLLENIRDDVPQDIYDAMMARFGGDDNFRDWFRVMATQFHCRILGQTLRLAIVGGRPDLLKYIPRVQNYIRKGLEDPVLAPLAAWMKEEKVDLSAQGCFDPEKVKEFIRYDAF